MREPKRPQRAAAARELVSNDTTRGFRKNSIKADCGFSHRAAVAATKRDIASLPVSSTDSVVRGSGSLLLVAIHRSRGGVGSTARCNDRHYHDTAVAGAVGIAHRAEAVGGIDRANVARS